MGFLAGKRAFIVGVATDRSIAWGIAQAMHREGAQLAFSYVNDKMRERVEPLAHSLGSHLTMPLDVTVDGQCVAAFELLKREWGELDIVVHAVAFAPREALTGSFVQATSREGFRKMLGRVAEIAPLRRNVTLEDVGNAAAFLCSDLAAGITGEILYVDSGFSTVGMSFPLEGEG
ncbi:MAG TPA: SDR family oxidoreductase [Steroidobacteraceae bacterium]|nr:SDR family oxidoreductase [Steroidobacteraceae bacterium]